MPTPAVIPKDDDFFFLAMAHWQLGNKEQARHRYDRTAQWMESCNLLNGDDNGFRLDAEALLGIKDKPQGKKEETPTSKEKCDRPNPVQRRQRCL